MPNKNPSSRRSGVRGKLFFASLGLMLAFGLLIGAYLEGWLRDFLRDRVQADLLAHAKTLTEALSVAALPIDDKRAMIARMSEANGYRITWIDHDGRIIADSALTDQQLRSAPNQATRDDFIKTVEHGWAIGQVNDLSNEDPSLYGATSSDIGVVRTTISLSSAHSVIKHLRLALLGAAFVGLAVAAAMSLVSAQLLTRELRILVGHARALARGERSSLPWYSTEELGRLAGSFTKLAHQLEQTMDTLAKERTRFSVVLESMSEAVLTVNKSLEITLVNSACVSILGFKGDPIGQRLTDPLDLPDLLDLAKKGREGSAAGEVKVGGRVVLARAMPLATTGGTVIVMHDVTEMRRLEIIRKDFVANVSHELRTPVSIVRANAETLLEGAIDDPERARYFIEALYRNADRLSRIIADLLDLSQIEAGQYQLSLRAVSLSEAFDRTIESLLARADSRRISLETHLDEDLHILADRKATDQILRNLVENGIKYTPEGGRVRLHAYQIEDRIRIEIEDNGQGIPEVHWNRIFERFYRVDTGRSRDMGGTGLGLAIVKHLAESMSGTVGVEAGEPAGARFWLLMPRSRISEITGS